MSEPRTALARERFVALGLVGDGSDVEDPIQEVDQSSDPNQAALTVGMAMLTRVEVERAVALQAGTYQLLRWLEKALSDGFIAPEAAHSFGTLEQSTYAWLDRQYLNLPDAARPAREDLPAFSRLFSTYLTNTFDLDASPGERLYSPDAHCFCPMCSWMVRVPHLTPKKVGPPDKKLAENVKRGFIRALAARTALVVDDSTVEDVLRETSLREVLGLCAYASDLLRRLEGIAIGPASLALWRSFAWTPHGSPRQGFKLSAEAIMDAQATLTARISLASRP